MSRWNPDAAKTLADQAGYDPTPLATGDPVAVESWWRTTRETVDNVQAAILDLLKEHGPTVLGAALVEMGLLTEE